MIVLVSGSPGSGKTTLARLLAQQLALPHLNKDAIRDGMRFTSGPGSTDEALVWELFYSTVEQWLDGHVSLVVDFTTYEGVTEAELTRRVMTRGRLLNVHCRATTALDRFARRIATHPHFGQDHGRVMRQRDDVEGRAAEWLRPLAIGSPIIEVDTTSSFEPDLDLIKQWLLEQSGRVLPLQGRRP